MSAPPRLGAAKMILSWSDADGFRIRHGSKPSSTLLHVPAEKLAGDEWDRLWFLIRTFGKG